MKPIPFSCVNNRKLSLQSNFGDQKISFRTVSKNLNSKNLLTFVESGCTDNADAHYNQCISLYDKLLSKNIPEQEKYKINKSLLDNLPKVSKLDSVYQNIKGCNNIDDDTKNLFFNNIDILENCDRIIRNESKLLKRFDLAKIINENIGYGLHHTVFELCSLLDTYSMSSKAKLNIALENVSYALYKSGKNINLNEVTEYIAEYFLTRDCVITDKEYNGYIEVLENNTFIDSQSDNISYIFNTRDEFNTSFANVVDELSRQCEAEICSDNIKRAINIKNEKQASDYIENTISMIIDNTITKHDSLLLLKGIYCLPLIGYINKEFINYKIEMSDKKLEIKRKLTDIPDMQDDKIIRDVLNDGDMFQISSFVTDNIQFNNYLLSDNYVPDESIKESEEISNSETIDKIINTFKASNEKSNSRFKNMISRIMTKSADNIINETPNIFASVRIMLYLAVTVSNPLGPVFAAIIALINKLLTTHLDLKQAEKLLKHLKSEKEKADKKLEKLSGKEKENQEEYIKCLKDCIKKTEDFISKIDDENENLDNSDDFDFGFDDFNFESTLNILESVNIICSFDSNKLIEKIFNNPYIDTEALKSIAVLVDNCDNIISSKYFDNVTQLKNLPNISVFKMAEYSVITDNAGKNKIKTDNPLAELAIQYEATEILQQVVNEGLDLNTLKMAVVNFKKKFRDLKGKEQELWRNIDIATSQLSKSIQRALTSDRREAIIKGSIIPSFSKCIKSAIAVGAVGAFTGPVGAAITAVGMLGASKYLNERERKLLYDEIDTELQVVDKQIQLAENEGDMNQYRFLLNYQKKLTREKQRIKYGIHMSGRTIPEIKKGE